MSEFNDAFIIALNSGNLFDSLSGTLILLAFTSAECKLKEQIPTRIAGN